MNFFWISSLLLLAINSCQSADSKYNLYYNNQNPSTSYDASYKDASSTYSSSSKSLYTKSYQENVKGLNKRQLEEIINNLYAKMQITSNQISSVLTALEYSKYYTTITPGSTLQTEISQLMKQIKESTYLNKNGTSNLITIYENREKIEIEKAKLEEEKAKYSQAIQDMQAAIQRNDANTISDVNAALIKAKNAADAIVNSDNTAAIALDAVKDVIDTLVSNGVTGINSNAITDAYNFANEANTNSLPYQNITNLSPAVNLTDANLLVESLGETYGGFCLKAEAAVNGGLTVIDNYLSDLTKLSAVSYLNFITGMTEAQILDLDNQILIQLKAQQTINDAFTIQAKLPSAMKFTYEIIFYAESIQNDAIEAGQAVIQIAKLEKGVLGSSSYGTSY